jgi:hypothetical protein
MIPRRCPQCQHLFEEAESRIPATSPLWAVPSVLENAEPGADLASNSPLATPGGSGADAARHGVLPAT